MLRIFAAISLVLLTLSCGETPDFSGEYGTRYLGQPVQLHLQQAGGKLTGKVTYGRVSGPLQATILAGKASGFVDAGLMGRFPFEAELNGDDGLNWKYLLALPGQTQALELEFERRSDAESTVQGTAQLDPALVGHWRRTISNSVAGMLPRDNMNVATDVFCTLSSDGSFQFGGAVTGVTSPGASGTTGASEVSSGEWKAKGGELFSRAAEQAQWTSLGRYVISGSSLVLYVGDQKQLWERQ